MDALFDTVKAKVKQLYAETETYLPFHGWHHIDFVTKHARRFAPELNADPFLTGIAALTHDLNYMVKVNTTVDHGNDFRRKILAECGVSDDASEKIETIILHADIAQRSKHPDRELSPEAKALSDADTLFKSIPITAIILSPLFLQQQGGTLENLSRRITEVQTPLMEKGVYFYSDSAKKYMHWAKTNLQLWQNLVEYFDDPEIQISLPE